MRNDSSRPHDASIDSTLDTTGASGTLALPTIDFRKHVLENGLQVIVHEDHKLPFVCVNLWYHVGSKNEEPGRTGFAHLFEHMMFEGSKNAPDGFVKHVEELGANLQAGGVNASTSWDRTNYYSKIPSEALDRVLWLEADRMNHLIDALTQDKLDNQRDVVKNERRQRIDNVPYGRAWEVGFGTLLPPQHPYSWPIIGSMDHLDAASLDDIATFFKRFYVPDNCSLTVAGDVDPDAVLAGVERYFGGALPGGSVARLQSWVPAVSEERRVIVRDDVPRSRLYALYCVDRAFSAEEPALDLASAILSTGKNSRLFKRLVHETQMASDVSTSNLALELTGIFVVQSTARPGVDITSIEEIIDEEIGRLASDGPDQDELDRAKAGLESVYIRGLETIVGKANILNQYNTHLGTPDYFRKDYERYKRVTGADVQQVTRQYLAHRRRASIIFAPQTSTVTVPETPRGEEQTPPSIGERRAFTTPEVNEQTLPNGLRIWSVERSELPIASAALFCNAGGRFDPTGGPGLAWMTASLLTEGTTSRNTFDISDLLQRLGSRVFTGGGYLTGQIHASCLSRHAGATFELLSDALLNPTFPPDEVERIKKRRMDLLAQQRADAGALAGRTMREELFGATHPYGHPLRGTEEFIPTLTPEQLRDFHSRHWQPADATLVVAGQTAPVIDAARELLSPWSGNGSSYAPVATPATHGRIVMIDRPGSAQTELRFARIIGPRDASKQGAIDLARAVLGGAFTSRINLNLREDKGYTYGARLTLRHVSDSTYAIGTTAVQTDVTAAAISEFVGELRRCVDERPIEADELERTRANRLRGYAQEFESLSSIVDRLGGMVALGQPPGEVADQFARMQDATLDQTRDAAREMIGDGQFLIVAVGDAARIEESVRQLELGPMDVRRAAS